MRIPGSVGWPTVIDPYISLTAWTTSSFCSLGTSIRVADTHACPAVMATATIPPRGASRTASSR